MYLLCRLACECVWGGLKALVSVTELQEHDSLPRGVTRKEVEKVLINQPTITGEVDVNMGSIPVNIRRLLDGIVFMLLSLLAVQVSLKMCVYMYKLTMVTKCSQIFQLTYKQFVLN